MTPIEVMGHGKGSGEPWTRSSWSLPYGGAMNLDRAVGARFIALTALRESIHVKVRTRFSNVSMDIQNHPRHCFIYCCVIFMYKSLYVTLGSIIEPSNHSLKLVMVIQSGELEMAPVQPVR